MARPAARHISREGLAAREAELRELETEGRRAIAGDRRDPLEPLNPSSKPCTAVGEGSNPSPPLIAPGVHTTGCRSRRPNGGW